MSILYTGGTLKSPYVVANMRQISGNIVLGIEIFLCNLIFHETPLRLTIAGNNGKLIVWN